VDAAVTRDVCATDLLRLTADARAHGLNSLDLHTLEELAWRHLNRPAPRPPRRDLLDGPALLPLPGGDAA
jgi:hypothetical protein